MGILDNQPVDFNYFLARKYALQGQEADATTRNAASTAIQANTGALVGQTVAAQNVAQTKLLPAESAARIAAQNAQVRNLDETTRLLAPQAEAGIGLTRAQTTLAGVGALSTQRNELASFDDVAAGKALPALSSILPQYRLPSFTPLAAPRRASPSGVSVFRGF